MITVTVRFTRVFAFFLAAFAASCSDPMSGPSSLPVTPVKLAGDWTLTLSFPRVEDSWLPVRLNGSIAQDGALVRATFLSPSPAPGAPDGNHSVTIDGELVAGTMFRGRFDMVNRAGRCASSGLPATGEVDTAGQTFIVRVPRVETGCRLPNALLTMNRK